MPPVIRLTDLGIRQVPVDLVEVGEAFGSTPGQLLWKIQLPVAMPTIMAGLNQTMMLSLSMVVITAMIGVGGLGAGVLYAIGQIKIGMGFENGVAVVILAIILDRITQAIGNSNEELAENKDKFGGEIIGIDPGAGIMLATERALEDYGLDFKSDSRQ